ncbi:phasin family protein [Sphingomonas azotifigens]|uniref:phasin family protein n=1 Tax=Sphingomonas azotifigens TaxID=330920 RepID=UPI000A04FAB0|nr:phasin family protein [Sphingomonas azotifigens]
MASKGPKTTAKPAAKSAARGAPAPAIMAEAAAATPEPAPITVPETIVPAAALVPAPADAVASQEEKTNVEETLASPVETATAVAEAAIEATETVAPAVTTSTAKEPSIMATTYENATTQAHTAFADFNERTKAAVEKSTKLVEEANEFAKGNIEALVESGRIAAKGFESLGQEAADYSRRSFESATAALKNLSAVKSPTEFFKLQSDYLRGAFDSYVAETSKHTEAFIKLAGDAAQPISNRFAVAVEKVKTNA